MEFCLGWESGRAAHDAHLSDDKAVAKMGHPDLGRDLCVEVADGFDYGLLFVFAEFGVHG